MNKKIIETLKNTDNEATGSPYWLILDPQQNMKCSIHALAMQITGPFFSREDAQNHLHDRRYAYSGKAKVYCMSGHRSRKYEAFCRSLNIGR